MVPRFGKYWPVLTLLLLELVLFAANFRPGTFLVGWDSLYPEFNFEEGLKRGVFAVWQEYRGLGLYDGMAHAANLFHTLFIWLLSLFLPINLTRYFFIFLMHFIGGIGIYLLLRRITKSKLPAFLGALFYLFNLATIQMFYVPFEVFIVHFAFLPWLVYSLLRYLYSPNRKNLLYFALFSLLSGPQAFVPQVFISYLVLVVFISFFFWLKGTGKFRHVLLVTATVFIMNSYWVLPYVYGLPANSKTIIEAKINQMSSEDIYLKNKARGGLFDILFLKGFMLDMSEYTKDGEFAYIMKDWKKHSASPLFQMIATGFLFVSVFGIWTVFRRRERLLYPFAATGLFAFLILGSNIPGINLANSVVRDFIPLVKEAFRFSFTKFSVLFAFCYAIFFALGLDNLTTYVEKGYKKVLLFVVPLLVFFYAYPAFKDGFFFDSLRLKTPQGYFQTIGFFKTQDKSARIATFPQPKFWSWRFNNWGYRGSGFLWFGTAQPTLDRAFDPWSSYNENYYWEISYALYSKNQGLFEQVFDKYQINWVLVDESVINPPSPKALFLDELEEMLADSDKFSPAASFGKIKVYQVRLDTPVNNFVYLAQNLPVVEPDYKWNNYDIAFSRQGHYISQIENENIENSKSTVYPFRSLFTGKRQEDTEFSIEEKEDGFVFSKTFGKTLQNYTLKIPDIDTRALTWINPYDLSYRKFLHPDIFFDGTQLAVRIPKIKGYFSEQIDPAYDLSLATPKNCSNLENGSVQNKIIQEGESLFLRLSAVNAQNCSAAFFLPNLPHNFGYLITVEARHKQGKSLLFWIENTNTRKADLETYLSKDTRYTIQNTPYTSYFVHPPIEKDGVGYTLHFDNISIGNEKTINDLGKITVNPIPYEFLANLVLTPSVAQSQPGTYYEVEAEHPNPSLYQIGIRNQELGIRNSVLVLSQAFNKGWQAYFVDSSPVTRSPRWSSGEAGNSLFATFLAPFVGEKIDSHVLVNNWANGWILDTRYKIQDTKITIIFLPQYLEYLGFFLLFAYFLFLFSGILKNRMTDNTKPVGDIALEDEEGRPRLDPTTSPAVQDEESASGSAPSVTSDDDVMATMKGTFGTEPKPGQTMAEMVDEAERARRRPPEEPEEKEEK